MFKINSFAKKLLNLNSKKEKEFKHSRKAKIDRERFLKQVTTNLNTEGWLKKHLDGSNDIEFADNEVLELYNRFLEHRFKKQVASFDCTKIDLLNEWHELVSHANRKLCASTVSYLKTWYHIFDSSKAREDFKTILLLDQICFAM